MSKYFKNNMHCMYLDQFAVSNICGQIPNNDWEDISELIKIGIERKKIICPTSIEHLLETSGKSIESASKHDNEFRKLSFGWSFYPAAAEKKGTDIFLTLAAVNIKK